MLTENEPDADILSLTDDEARKVLIFKMPVAPGFAAPRSLYRWFDAHGKR